MSNAGVRLEVTGRVDVRDKKCRLVQFVPGIYQNIDPWLARRVVASGAGRIIESGGSA